MCILMVLPYSTIEAKTLGEIRKEIIGKEGIILGDKDLRDDDTLSDWFLAEKTIEGGYQTKSQYLGGDAPYNLKGSKAKVVAVEFSKYFNKQKHGTSVDMFGDIITEDNTEDPWIDLVVQLQNGTFLLTSSTIRYESILYSRFKLIPDYEEEKDRIFKNIDSLVGKVIYPVAWSTVFPPDADIKMITNRLMEHNNKLNDIPNLTPLTIIKAKYLENEHAILLKVEFLGDRTGIIYCPDIMSRQQYQAEKRSFSEFVIEYGGFYTEVPKDLNEEEIKAIKKSLIFTGMSQDALNQSWGFPKKENDWGTGGKQLIYGDNLFVYIKDKKVVDWQSLAQ